MHKRVLHLAFASATLSVSALFSQVIRADVGVSEDLIDQIREQVTASTDLGSLGTAYAAMANFAVVPDISTATYRIDDGSADDPELSVRKIPLKFYFADPAANWQPFLQVNLAYQDLDAGFRFLPGEGVNTSWQTRALSLAGGLDIPLNDQLTFTPAFDIGIIDLENNASYFGAISSGVLRPAFKGLLFDWDAKARLLGASVSLDYRNEFAGKDLRLHTTLTNNHVESFSESSRAIGFSEGVTTLTVDGELVIPTSLTLFERPVSVVPQANYSTFLGGDRDQLGFSDFVKLGVAGEIDISNLDYGIKKLRLGLEVVKGSDVDGIVFELGYRY